MTRPEIEELKQQWLADPCWDIEDTEGFETHKEELLHFRENVEQKDKEQRDTELKARAAKLKCSIALVLYIERLENKLARLEKRVYQ